MKLLFIYLAVILAISFYLWNNVFKEGILGTKEDSTMTTKEVEMNFIQRLINGMNSDGTSNDKSTDKDTKQLISKKVTPGITTIDRYQDDSCSVDEYIYCVDGQIECQDIFGSAVSNNLQADVNSSYTLGATFKNTCGSYINKANLTDYTKEIKHLFSNTKGVYFDPSGVYFDLSRNKILSECTIEKPWRVGGNNGVPKQGCFSSESEADAVWFSYLNTFFNKNASYSKNDHVLVLASFLNSPDFLNKNPGTLSILNILDKATDASTKSYTTINGQKYYYGIINEVNNDTYNVSLTNTPKPSINPGDSTVIKNIPKTALLKDSLYNPKTNDYYSNLGTGSKKRPVCKSGSFTTCLSSAPFSIKNGEYVPEKDPLVLDASYNKYRKQSRIDLNSPFTSPGVNPSGIIDESNLLQYNYFTSKDNESPFIKCVANYGSKIGDPLCCNQPGTLKDTKRICPEEIPTCMGYSASDNMYGYCN